MASAGIPYSERATINIGICKQQMIKKQKRDVKNLFGVNTAAEIGGKEGQAITIERLHTQATTTAAANMGRGNVSSTVERTMPATGMKEQTNTSRLKNPVAGILRYSRPRPVSAVLMRASRI